MVLHGTVLYCVVGFGAWAVSRKTPIYFIIIIIIIYYNWNGKVAFINKKFGIFFKKSNRLLDQFIDDFIDSFADI